jgi:pyrrolidone-carboxylate peptidase
MKYLITGFQNNSNSSKQMALELSNSIDKSEVLIFNNNRELCVKQLYSKLKDQYYENIIMFGQKPLIKNKIYIERQARIGGNVFVSDFNSSSLIYHLKENENVIKESDNAGTSYCNWIYYHTMKYIQEYKLKTKVVFIHIPLLNNISDIRKLVDYFRQVLS